MQAIKYALKNWRSNLPLNLLLLVQLMIMLFVLMYSVYTFHSKYKYYTVFAAEISKEGILVDADSFVHNGAAVNDSSYLEEFYDLRAIDKIMGRYSVFATVEDHEATIKAYDNEIIERFVPDMEEGCWLNRAKKSDGYIEAVVSYNQNEISVGDYISISDGNVSYKLKIVGVLEKNAAIFSKNINTSYKEDYTDMYWNYSTAYEESMLLLVNKEHLEDTNLFYMLTGNMLVCYDDNISEEDKAENLIKLCKSGAVIYSTDFNIIYDNTWRILRNELTTFVPISMLLFLITLFTSVQISHINIIRTQKNFAVYYMLGNSWRKCIAVSVISSTISMFIAVVANYILILLLMFNNKIDYDIGLVKYVSVIYLGVVLIYVLIVMIYQTYILKRFTPYQIIRGENND